MPAPQTPHRPGPRPWAYFLTFACYGARLHGDPRGSVDRDHRVPFTRYLDASPPRVAFETHLMAAPAVLLDELQRKLILDAFLETCRRREWDLHAAHIRTNHAHLVLTADIGPESAMAKLKAYASRALNESFGHRKRWWAAHGSTRWLWDIHETTAAVHYVIGAQGARMSLHISSPTWLPRDYKP